MNEKGEKKIFDLGGRAKRGREGGVPGKQTLGKERKGRVWKQKAGREKDIKLIQAGRHQAHGRR